MRLTATVLAGSLATLATACTPDLRAFTITNLVQIYTPNEGTSWSFTATRSASDNAKPFHCTGYLPINQPAGIKSGICEGDADNVYAWTADGYDRVHPRDWDLQLEMRLEHCPPDPNPQNFRFATKRLNKTLVCEKEKTCGKNRVEVTRCETKGPVEAASADFSANGK